MIRVCVLTSAIVLVGAAGAQPKKAEPVVEGKTVGAWAKALAGKELLPRIRAVNALMRAGPEARAAAPALIELFRDSDATFLHPLAAVTLSRMGEAAVPALQKALGDRAASVRSNSALTLGLIGPAARAAVPALTAALKDADASVRQAAAQALGRVGSSARPAATRLYDLLSDRDVPVCIEAALSLWHVAGDVRGVGTLAAAVVSGKEDRDAFHALECLGEIGAKAKAATSALGAALKSKSPSLRVAVAETLYRVSGEAKRSLPVLLAELRAKDRNDRLRAVAALGTLAPDAGVVVHLTKLLADADFDIRREAACALSEGGVELGEARAALEACLNHIDAGVRGWAAVALAAAPGDIRKHESEILRILRSATYRLPESSRKLLSVRKSNRAVPALAAILKSRSGPLAVEAARSLAHLDLDARAARAELFVALGSNDKMLSRQAAAALATLNVEVVPQLVRLLGNENARLRAGAARALGLIGLPARSHTGALVRLLKDGEAPVRTAAALALWRIDGNAEVALPVLNRVLKDLDARDRWEAVEGIGTISVEARPPIRGLLEIVVGALEDRDARVRMQAAKWLWRRTRQAKVIIPLVRDGVTDRDPLARLTAVETLGEMGTEDRVVGLLTSALEDRSPSNHLAAVVGLARGVPVKQLVALVGDKTPRVRLAAVHALGLVGPDAKSSLPALLALRLQGGAAARAADQVFGELFPANPAVVGELLTLLGKWDKADEAGRVGIAKEVRALEKKLLATP